MLSQPDRVRVDHPGAAGLVSAAVGSMATGVSDMLDENATASSPAPWTIGATDRTLALSASSSPAPPDFSNGPGSTLPPLAGHTGLRRATPSPPPPTGSRGGAAIGTMGEAMTLQTLSTLNEKKYLYHDRLLHPSSDAVEAVLASSCDVMGFDIAEMWLRTGPKTHQLTNSHLRPAALEDSVRNELIDVYYGERSSERTHLLSPALCKRAKEAMDVVWVTAHTPQGAEALRISISDVRTAVAVPICHEASNTNVTIIYFSIRRIMMKPTSVEFLVHMSLAAAVASVNEFPDDGLIENQEARHSRQVRHQSQSEHAQESSPLRMTRVSEKVSITGASLDLKWRQLHNVEYLTDGGNSWIHTAVFNGRAVVVKTLKPECQDVALAINEIEGELAIHSRLNHPNICSLLGAGTTSKGVRFVVLDRLDGGTMSQMLGYDNRIRDRRRRFWRRKQLSYLQVLGFARSVADAMAYLQGRAIPGSMVLHRDLKPDNIGFTLKGEVKLIDFGLARVVENSSPTTDEAYEMSGETGSLRYMSPEVANSMKYNHKADVYSFGIILWELNAYKKPFEGLSRESFYERVVNGGERPPVGKKWPGELVALMSDCWSADMTQRPTFDEIVERLDALLAKEKGGAKVDRPKRGLSGLIDRHSTWF